MTHWMQRQNHKSFRVPESWGEMFPKHNSKGKNLPTQGLQGSRYRRHRMLLYEQKWREIDVLVPLFFFSVHFDTKSYDNICL